jgi:SAM-dependent methyltransferase
VRRIGRRERVAGNLRRYWEDRARTNAAWYVDTTLSYEAPDMERFFATGESIVAEALDESEVRPVECRLAVEIGSGLGRVCKALATRFDAVVGVDISTTMVERSRELVPVPQVSFVLGDGSSLPGVADGSADLVLSFTVFQHIPSVAVIDRYLQEAGRVLRPTGVFVFQWNNEPGARRWRARSAWLTLLQRTRIRPETYGRHVPEFLGIRVPLGRIERGLRTAGLELVDTKGTGTLFAWAWARPIRERSGSASVT